MNIIGELTRTLNIPESSACGLAGQVFGFIEDVVRERVSFGVASQLHSAIPELLKWQQQSPTIVPGSLTLADLSNPRETTDEGEFIRLLERFHLTKEQAPSVAALVMQFLESRIDSRTLTIVAFTLPVLAQPAHQAGGPNSTAQES